MMFMKRATMTLPDELAKAVEDYRLAQENPPSLTKVVQAALREYLTGRGFIQSYRPLKLTVLGRSGRTDVSQNHDLYLAGIKK
jgi:metal-responsive CopG/Arc/MetJ family transcriptional regulator